MEVPAIYMDIDVFQELMNDFEIMSVILTINIEEKNSLRHRGSNPGPWFYVPSALTTELPGIRRPEFECSGPQLEGPEFECSGPQLEGPEFEYSELSLKVVTGFFSLPNFQNGPEVHSASYKIEYRVFPGVKGGQSVVPTTPPHSSAEVMESMGLYLHAPKCLHGMLRDTFTLPRMSSEIRSRGSSEALYLYSPATSSVRLQVGEGYGEVVVITDVQNVHLLLEYRPHIDVSLTCEHDPKLQEYCICPQNMPQFDSEGIPNQAPETNKPMILNGHRSRNREGSDQVSVEAKELGHLYLSIDQETFDPSTGEPYV
ncbi:hypothetical protein ANN_25860 [Periplaneta americana]|uniref:Uncharacterized protein n=1 Tax=Periplaneta americana TaxID=6978 RepID=A0ABQ8S4R3_PERAM|nr:hypothetical protein ANN_25860 [Periplaneta americana]